MTSDMQSGFYRSDPDALAQLIRDSEVHRDVYISEEIFQLEQERLFAKTWLYVGHDSQVPEPGDYITLELAGTPVILIRHPDGEVRVLINRCPHKGAPVLSEPSGKVERLIRCPYHAWNFGFDGRLLGVSLKAGYRDTGFEDSIAANGLSAPGGVAVYRGFVFARLSPEGIGFKEYFGKVLQTLDNMADRSPDGQLQVAAQCIRSDIHCNWKMYIENINDSVHPVSTHESASATAGNINKEFANAGAAELEQLLPFGAGYDFYSKMGARVLPHGHSISGTEFSIHSGYSDVPGYQAQLEAAYGAERTREILSFSPQNVVLYPSMAAKGSPQIIRVLRPLAANRTRLEVWAFQPKGAPNVLLERGLMYARLVFSPMSIVAHDDVCLFEGMQKALVADANPWINLQRQFDPAELGRDEHELDDGNNELLMRNQFREWRACMTKVGEKA